MGYHVEASQIGFIDILKAIIRRKIVIFVSVILTAVMSVLYIYNADKLYKVTVLSMLAVDEASSFSSKLGGLSSFLGEANGNKSQLNLAIIKSKSFARLFIAKNDLIKDIFWDIWDGEHGSWKLEKNQMPPSIDAAVERFQKRNLAIDFDSKSSMITLDLIWHDAEKAVFIANNFMETANEFLRKKTIEESNASLVYLKKQISETKEIEVKDMLYAMVQSELQRVKVAESKADYALEVIDPAIKQPAPVKPQKTIIFILSIFAGFILGFLYVFIVEFVFPKFNDFK